MRRALRRTTVRVCLYIEHMFDTVDPEDPGKVHPDVAPVGRHSGYSPRSGRGDGEARPAARGERVPMAQDIYLRDQATLLALVKHADREWHRVADLAEEAGSAIRLAERSWTGFETFDTADAEKLIAGVTDTDIADYERLILRLRDEGVSLTTVLDDSYPTNLRHIYNRPPFLFLRGQLLPQDDYSVAVVGTRTASHEGLEQASRLASELAERRVTVLSGMALGIDAAAHEAALAAGGRTIAVMGTGIRRIYPKDHADLAGRIVSNGALVSQFWPDSPPTKQSFPMRNIVTSGLAIGTVVIEAGRTSGAKSQARHALEHGKRLFLIRSLVMQEEWAQKAADHPATTVVDSVDDILQVLVRLARPPEQLTLA